MRIVAGSFRGRPIATPKGDTTRPTSDRVREAVFNILGHNPALRPPGLTCRPTGTFLPLRIAMQIRCRSSTLKR